MNTQVRLRFSSGVLPVALTAVLLAGCDLAGSAFSSEARDTWSRTYPLAAGGQVEIRNTNGSIDVRAAAGDRVEVTAERIARAGSDTAARELLDQIDIAEQVSADAIRLDTRSPSGAGVFAARTEVRYTVAVPSGAQVQVATMNGALDIQDVRGALDASTTNGGITARGLAGRVDAHTTNGGIEMEVEHVTEGGVSLSTTNGGIELRISANARADLHAQVSNGGIDVAGFTGFEPSGEASRRQVAGRLNGGGPAISARTTNGGIRIAPR